VWGLREENLGLQERLNKEIRGKNDAKNAHLVFKGKVKEDQEEKLCQIDVLECEN
jgi:predicted nuclease with TOPRIM domain